MASSECTSIGYMLLVFLNLLLGYLGNNVKYVCLKKCLVKLLSLHMEKAWFFSGFYFQKNQIPSSFTLSRSHTTTCLCVGVPKGAYFIITY
jgi:hypothetical protein